MKADHPPSRHDEAMLVVAALDSMIEDVVRTVSERVPLGTLPSRDELRAAARLGAELAVAERAGAIERGEIAQAARGEVEAALWSLGGVVVGPCF